ncbi:oxidoreductase [Flavobacterium akiainvivens]|uniref:Oxidoreductase n=1 Tax=Flavobacterium akiainvivens TaxID=1202724 RepID=A0A0M8MCJ5_9FLAO|nr:SDR family NAD(P)-dependent oxidoreductase [Flavobacterium akiainvivens]KOS05954.1 oxidoreductase [Flavobacterium akiainvivens]SFQ53610.1 NAD(P)-dependent dehydrogenase, short-chain alcohol dehydrogenase family [Flavobacterium akiainvivens]
METTVSNYNGALQQPLNSGFNAQSTTQDVINGISLTGKTAIVTGGYAGIGLETTKTLVQAGAKVIVPARDVAKAQRNLAGIDAQIWAMDLMDAASIDAFALRFLNTGSPLHLLINNAGIMWVPLRRDARGYESQLSTNHLGHFQLTARLWPALKKANVARMVNVSSFGHQMAPFNFNDPNFEHREYETLLGYGQSKSANILFAVELAKRGAAHGVKAYSLHPGAVGDTDLNREGSDLLIKMGMLDADGNVTPEMAARLKTIQQGAATNVWCATSPQLDTVSGVYCEDCDVAPIDNGGIQAYEDRTAFNGVQPYAVSRENAQKLWAMSETMTGVAFNAE